MRKQIDQVLSEISLLLMSKSRDNISEGNRSSANRYVKNSLK